MVKMLELYVLSNRRMMIYYKPRVIGPYLLSRNHIIVAAFVLILAWKSHACAASQIPLSHLDICQVDPGFSLFNSKSISTSSHLFPS